VTKHPEQVRTLVAHEPPLARLLPDRDEALAAIRDIDETYQRDGLGPGMAKFIAIVMHKGPVPDDFADLPAPDPAMFGLPTVDNGSRDDVLLGQNLITNTHYQSDSAALGASTRIVVVAGAESEGELAHPGAEAAAEQLGTTLVNFPSDHGGFLGCEYGQTGDPEAFAAALRKCSTRTETRRAIPPLRIFPRRCRRSSSPTSKEAPVYGRNTVTPCQ